MTVSKQNLVKCKLIKKEGRKVTDLRRKAGLPQREETNMPLYHMKALWTPASILGLKFLKTEDGHVFMKVRKQSRKRIR